MPFLLFRHSPSLPQIMHKNWMSLLKYCSHSVALQSPVAIFSLHLFHATSTFSTSGWVIKSVPPQLPISSGFYILVQNSYYHSRKVTPPQTFSQQKGKDWAVCWIHHCFYCVLVTDLLDCNMPLRSCNALSQWVLHSFNPLWFSLSVQTDVAYVEPMRSVQQFH